MAKGSGQRTAVSARVRRYLPRRWRYVWRRRPAAGPPSFAAAGRTVWLYQSDFPADLSEIPTARRRVAVEAESCGLSGPALFDLLLATGEALANAVKHGSPNGALDRVRVSVGTMNGAVVVQVRDQGKGFGVARICPPEIFESGGRGIPFMRALLDDLRVDCQPDGTTVLLLKRIDR